VIVKPGLISPAIRPSCRSRWGKRESAMELTYCSLITISSLLVLTGIVVLTILIPASSKWFRESDTKTEFYSVRAAYWCAIVGISVLGLILIGGLVQHILILIRTVPSTR
jgi:integral membrane sensor domain MASE1